MLISYKLNLITHSPFIQGLSYLFPLICWHKLSSLPRYYCNNASTMVTRSTLLTRSLKVAQTLTGPRTAERIKVLSFLHKCSLNKMS